MTQERITLQNTPERTGTRRRRVAFESNGNELAGILYLPEHDAGDLPAVVVTGAWTTVKEQMPGTYARELAARGFAALAFDFTGWGESAGEPRFVEDPVTKTADIRAAAEFLATLDRVDARNVSALGICASSGYAAAAVADDDRFAKVALVAPWLHDPAMAEEIYGGPEAVASLIASSDRDDVAVAASTEDESAVMYQAPYYTEDDRGLIPEYDNRFSLQSWKSWLGYDAQASADRLTKPMLMVGSPAIALPAGAAAYEARMTAPLAKAWLGDDATQFDFYDRLDVVTASADAVADFLA